MNDTTSAAPSDAEIDAQWRESVAKHETTAAFVRDFARAVLAKWGAPQPTQEQAGAVPLNHRNIEPVSRFLADRGIYLSDEATKALIAVAHGIGIKGGQHGADT